ncbi:hypothetical protein SLS64_013044 [Diaporthe eres]|uniref:Uncharacterized protein n=1 Tax=Diaporthe eres TaxID=83184 RepID=A0ABR1P5S7_DIAER
MKSSSDNSDPKENDRRMHRASGASVTAQEADLIDLSDSRNQNIMGPMSVDAGGSSPNNTSTNKGKTSFVTNVLGLWPLSRGSPQRPHPVNTEQHVKIRSKLEDENMALQKTCEKLRKKQNDAVIEIKRLGTKIELLEEQHQSTELGDPQKIEHLEDGIKSARALNERLLRRWKAAKVGITRLQSELDTADDKLHTAKISADEKIARLTAKVDATEKELFNEKSAARKEIAQLQSHTKLLNEKNDKFRQMLIPVSEKQVLDAEVVQKFTTLRSSIMALVRSTWTLDLRDDVDFRTFSRGQHHVFRSSGPSSYDRLRYVVFQHIHCEIFVAKNYFLKDGFEPIEEHLQMVEDDLIEKSSGEDRKLVMEWRNASFKATENFRGNGGRLSRDTQTKIWKFLGAVQMMDPAAESAGSKKLKAICDAAIDLSLIIRQLSDNFWVDNMEAAVGEQVSEWDKFTEEMAAVPAGDGKQPGTIAYVISGALIKNPKENLEKVLVLEKAEVAVYR